MISIASAETAAYNETMDDDRRVVPKPLVVAGGTTSTPEGIADLQRQRVELERRQAPAPKVPFAKVLGGRRKVEAVDERPDERPRRGPRPGLRHPSQRDTYGRDDGQKDAVVIKG